VTHAVATALRLVDLKAVDFDDEAIRLESGVRVPAKHGLVCARAAR
jgi:hypothetical protein